MNRAHIEEFLRNAQTAYRWRLLLRRAFLGIFLGALAALLWTLAVKTAGWSRALDHAAIKAGFLIAGAVIAACLRQFSTPDLYELAKRLDDHFRWGDQLSTAYALRQSAEDDPLVELVTERAAGLIEGVKAGKALPNPRAGLLVPSVVLWALSIGLPSVMYKVAEPEKIDETTRREIRVQMKKLDDLLKIEAADMTEEEKHQFERIQKMIQELQLEDTRISRKEMLARFSREIEGIQELEGGSEALKRALEQLKEMKEAVAAQMLVSRQVEEIEKQQTELAVVDEKTGQKLRAEEIQAMIVQEDRRKKQEALARDMKQVAAEEAAAEEKVTTWEVEPSETEPPKGEAKEAAPTAKKARVIMSYDDLVRAAEKKDIRKMIFAAASDIERTSPEYREVYGNYRRAFEHMLYQGSFSVGTRQYLQRYFRAIRPAPRPAAQTETK